jgi:hypothetical protein
MRYDARGQSPTRVALGPPAIVAFALLGCASLPTPVWAAGPQERVRDLVAAVSAVLEDSALQGTARKSERRARIATIIHEAFDFDSMARDALGPSWTTLTAEQQAEFTRLFGDRFEQSYSLLVLRFLGERRTAYVSESIDGSRATVRTFLLPARIAGRSLDRGRRRRGRREPGRELPGPVQQDHPHVLVRRMRKSAE